MTTSQNGYPVLESVDTKRWELPNVPSRGLTLAKGAPGFLLAYYADWHHAHIERLDKGVWDEWGWAVRPISGSDSISNHASGTACDLNAVKHPMGVRNTYGPVQRARIRLFLRVRMRGCIRWGGDYSGRPDDMHFEINRVREAVQRRAAKLRKSRRGKRVWRDN